MRKYVTVSRDVGFAVDSRYDYRCDLCNLISIVGWKWVENELDRIVVEPWTAHTDTLLFKCEEIVSRSGEISR